jgi:hypothetical protein
MRWTLVGAVLALAACSAPPRLAEVEGALSLGPGGPPAAGAWVYLEGPLGAWGARTDAAGRFRLFVPPGPYRAWVEGEGLAGSEVRGLSFPAGRAFLPLVALAPFRSGWPRNPPQVSGEAWVEGGLVRYRAGMEAQGGLTPLALLVGLGAQPGSLVSGVGEHFYLEETRDTGVRTLDPRGIGGPSELWLVAYDANNNRTALRIPLNLPGGEAIGSVRGLEAVAYTLARRVEALGLGGEYSLFVRLSWEGGGPYVLRRLAPGGDLTLAQLPKGSTGFTDALPGLLPGERVCYRVEAPQGAASACTTPLSPLSVRILSPEEGARTGPTPHLAWWVEGGEGARSFRFLPVIWDQLSGGGRFLEPTGATEAEAPPLLPGRPYAFELYQAYAVDDAENPSAYSVAADRQGVLSGVPMPGPAVSFEVGP